jgi:hypothetical protein
MKEKIDELLIDYEKYHSRYQIEHFIVGAQGNAWAKYKQCLREIKSRWENIESMKDEKRLLELDIKELGIKKFIRIRRATRISESRRSIKLNASKRKLADLEESLKHTLRELMHFISLAKRIKKDSWGEKIITGDLRKSLEAQMWFEKCTRMMAIDVIAFGQVSKTTVDMIFNMPKRERKELLAMMEPGRRENLIE